MTMLYKIINQIRWKWRLQLALRRLCLSVAVTLPLVVAVVTYGESFLIFLSFIVLIWSLAVISALTATFHDYTIARSLDECFALDNRVATAIHLSSPQLTQPRTNLADEFKQVQLQDTCQKLHQLDLRAMSPWYVLRDFRWVIFSALISIFLWYIIDQGADNSPTRSNANLPPSNTTNVVHPPILDDLAMLQITETLAEISSQIKHRPSSDLLNSSIERIEDLIQMAHSQSISKEAFDSSIDALEHTLHTASTTQNAIEDILSQEASLALHQLASNNARVLNGIEDVLQALESRDMSLASQLMQSLVQQVLNGGLDGSSIETLASLASALDGIIDQSLLDDLAPHIENYRDIIHQLPAQSFNDNSIANKATPGTTNRSRTPKDSNASQSADQQLNIPQRPNLHASTIEKFNNDIIQPLSRAQQNQDIADQLADLTEQIRQSASRNAPDSTATMQTTPRDGSSHKSTQSKQLQSYIERASGTMAAEVNYNQPLSTTIATDSSHNNQEFIDDLQPDNHITDDQLNIVPEMPSHIRGQDLPDQDGSNIISRQAAPGSKGSSRSDSLFGEGDESIAAKFVDEAIDLPQSMNSSRSEIIDSSHDSGFASTGYANLYYDYMDVVQEVIENEKTPASYRYFIQRYFQLIRPR